jgi:bacterioferritin-associated ferredoxin
MYICICHGLTDKDFRAAAAAGAPTVGAAFKALGEKPQCGRCLCCARDILAEEQREREAMTMAIAAE